MLPTGMIKKNAGVHVTQLPSMLFLALDAKRTGVSGETSEFLEAMGTVCYRALSGLDKEQKEIPEPGWRLGRSHFSSECSLTSDTKWQQVLHSHFHHFNCLSIVAITDGRLSFKHNKWLTITLLWRVLFCPGTL